MSLAELIPAIRALPPVDKLQLTQFLVVELAREEGVPLFEAGRTYEIWSPFDSFEAARDLMQLVEQAKKGDGL